MEDEKEKTSVGTPYDDVFRTMITDSSVLAVALINEMFGKDLRRDTEVILWQNEMFLADTKKRVTDSLFQIKGEEVYYHAECESTAGGAGILFRLFEYDSKIAVQHASIDEGILHVKFPMTGILYLRDTGNTPDELYMAIESPEDDGSLQLRVAVMKVSDYSLEDIFEKKLWFLLPFYVFNFEKGLKSNISDKVKRTEEEVLDYLVRIKERLNAFCEDGEDDIRIRLMLEDMISRVVCAVAGKSKRITEGVTSIMGGQVLEYEAKTIYNNGIKQGMKQGMKQGFAQGEEKGEERLASVISAMKAGKTPEDLSREGIGSHTIELAMKCM